MTTANQTAQTKALNRPIPDDCSDLYAAGWAYGDWYISKGGDLNADAPVEWDEEKVNGFWDRLTEERKAAGEALKAEPTLSTAR